MNLVQQADARTFLRWLITPQNENEANLLRQRGLIDDYIGIEKRILIMSEQELIAEINIQLLPYKLKI